MCPLLKMQWNPVCMNLIYQKRMQSALSLRSQADELIQGTIREAFLFPVPIFFFFFSPTKLCFLQSALSSAAYDYNNGFESAEMFLFFWSRHVMGGWSEDVAFAGDLANERDFALLIQLSGQTSQRDSCSDRAAIKLLICSSLHESHLRCLVPQLYPGFK